MLTRVQSLKLVAIGLVFGSLWLVSSGAIAGESCDKASGKALIISMKNDNDINDAKTSLLLNASDPVERERLKLGFGFDSTQLIEQARQDMTNSYKAGCKSGDVMSIPKPWQSVANDMCDFSKSIIDNGRSLNCVMR